MKKTIEETYQMMTQHEHVLKRPDTYIGSIVKQKQTEWVFKKDKIKQKEVEYVPGFLKIVDEAITNALDHSQRYVDVNTIKVDVSEETGEISVMNNGPGIPIAIHREHNIHVPEMIFGNLLTGSNYDDTEQRTCSGRNGLGVKLTSIFSKSFKIETVDSSVGKKYIQTFTENMTIKSKPKITDCSQKSYTKVTFLPDYEKFNMEGLDKSTFSLLKRRVYECIACTNKNVSIYFNGEKLKGKGLLDYASYFTESVPLAHEINGDWEYLVYQNQGYEQVSFVNGNHTSGGGKHVDFIVNQIVSGMKEKLEKKLKDQNVKANTIKDNLFIFVKCVIVNPKFTSQTKDVLSTPSKDFGNQIKVSEAFINKIYKSGITQEILEVVAFKNRKLLDKNVSVTKKSRISVKNLDDATNAGTSKSSQTTLLLTEGLSASSFAISGLSVVGRADYGVYALKGKCISFDTKVPLFDGEVKLARDIQVGDKLIGDDGKERNVLTLYKGNGKMYEIHQDRGDSYKVNDEHILTLCVPEHKSIYWYDSHSAWKAVYWDKTSKNIKTKEIQSKIKIKCNECSTMMNNACLKRHYSRKHKNLDFEKSKTVIDMRDVRIIEARKKLENFLSNIDDNNIIDICIKDYLNITKSNQKKLKGIRGECVKWKEQKILLDPYVLGLWLGDGSANGYSYACDGERDFQIIYYLKDWGTKNDANINISGKSKFAYNFSSINNFRQKGYSPLKKILHKYNLVKNKHIPKEYLVNSKEIRLKLLAGIIDTDGYVSKDGTIEISQTTKGHTRLSNDIVYLSRSLGFYTYIKKKVTNYKYIKTGEYMETYIIKISGYTEQIPTLIPRKKTRNTEQYKLRNSNGIIKICSIEPCDYIGIGIDGNSRFLINDFTVTHNCLNIREATQSQLLKNEEIIALKKIMGLSSSKTYETKEEIASLRYGSIGLLTDSDVDGVHIASLIMNFIHFWWPALMKIKGFIKTIRTPIVKLKSGNIVKKFYNEIEYKAFMETSDTKWISKYYKGLGTSTALEAKETFKELAVNTEIYIEDKNVNKSFNLAFNKKQANDRKTWLKKIPEGYAPRNERNEITYSDFINKELIHFSVYDNIRSIPNIMDGLKPSQRKVLYTAFKRNLKKEIKVAQFGASVAEETAYHHGEVSLSMTIIGMAQNYPGSNNINLLEPCGNFGYRNHNGKDAASPRYIFTHLTKSAQDLFIKEDEQILEYNEDDGVKIEPKFYVPTLPMVLINGVIGIGTGYSTNIPSYNPDDIRKNIHLLIEGKEMIDLVPWVKGFKGTITRSTETSFIMKGLLSKTRDNVLVIDEIPTNISISDYKDFLETFEEFSVKNESTENTPKFTLVFKNVEDVKKFNYTTLKLTSKINTSNMHLFTVSGELKKYDNPNEIIREFVKCKLEYLQKRKLNLIKGYKETLLFLKNKKRFLECIINESINVYKKTKMEIERSLVANKFDKIKESFSYLTSLPISSFTSENLDELEKSIKKYEELYKIDYNKSPVDFFKIDLNK